MIRFGQVFDADDSTIVSIFHRLARLVAIRFQSVVVFDASHVLCCLIVCEHLRSFPSRGFLFGRDLAGGVSVLSFTFGL